MATRGSIHHIALTASDLARSTGFYDRILGFMGYTRVEVPESTTRLMNTPLHAWMSASGAITLQPARGDLVRKAHERDAPGMNHLAFNAANRADVEAIHDLLKRIGARILDPPAEYLYFPGYYAVYFTDPDGLKIEYLFLPEP